MELFRGDQAADHKKMVEAIHVANVIANGQDVMETVHNCSNLDFDKINEILRDLESIKSSGRDYLPVMFQADAETVSEFSEKRNVFFLLFCLLG